MSLWNVSMVMSPNLFSSHRRRNKRSVTKPQEEMEEAVGGAYLIRLMIAHQDLLWIVGHMNTQSLSHITGLTMLSLLCTIGPQLPVVPGETHEPGIKSETPQSVQDHQTVAGEEE